MTPETTGVVAILFMLLLMLLRIPVAIAMTLSAFAGYTLLESWDTAVRVLGMTPFEIGSAYTLSVVPLFLLMGALASRMRMSQRLFAAAHGLFGRVRGSSAMATMGASAAFGAICGSSLATTSTIGRIAIPEMRREKYSDVLSSGAVAAGGTLGILIPPSIILVIYALISQQSVEQLFAAAFLPGAILLALYVLAIAATILLRSDAAPKGKYASLKERAGKIVSAWDVALLFLVSIGGLYIGWFTPTEAAAVGAFGALFIGMTLRGLTIRDVWESLVETSVTSAVLFLVILGSTFLAYFITKTRIPVEIVDMLSTLSGQPILIMLMIVAFYLLAGCFLDGISMVVATVPIILPVVTAIGFDPIWFGVLLVVVVEAGLITPPVGMNIFVIKSQAPDMDIKKIYQGVAPFLLAQAVLVALLLAIPGIALWLPGVLFG